MFRRIGVGFWITLFLINAFAAYNYYDVLQCFKRGGRMCMTIFTIVLSVFSPIAEVIYKCTLFWMNDEFKYFAMNAIILILMNIFIFIIYGIFKFIGRKFHGGTGAGESL